MRAERVARALGGRRVGSDWMACCPAHDDREPSLSITDAKNGNVLVRCHAGCDQRDVIAALRSRGLWGGNGYPRFTRLGPRASGINPPGRVEAGRTEAALVIWRAAVPANGTLVEAYLASRGLHLPPSQTLRFHAGLKHPSGDPWPAMIALVTHGSDNRPMAVHRTFLARDGNGKAPVDPQKMMLGPCHGGVVRLAPTDDALMVGEGIETCLSAMQVSGRPAWAALSTSGIRSLELPTDLREVIVLADGDKAGEAAARAAALRWIRQKRRVRIAHSVRGLDFNDMLLADPRPNRQGAVA